MSNLLVSSFDFSAIFGNIIEKWYLYLPLLLIIGLFIALFFVKDKERNYLSNTQKLVYTAMLTALCTILNCFITFYPQNYIAISFNSTICFVAGLLLGYKRGFCVGFLGDLIGAIIFPQGVYNPLIGLASGLFGFIPGLLFDKFRINKYLLTVISSIITLILCTCFLNTFGLWLIYGLGKKTFFAYLFVRLPWQTFVAVGNAVLCLLLVAFLPKVLPKNKFNLFNE